MVNGFVGTSMCPDEHIRRAFAKPPHMVGRDGEWEDSASYDGTLYRGDPNELGVVASAAEHAEPRPQLVPFPARS